MKRVFKVLVFTLLLAVFCSGSAFAANASVEMKVGTTKTFNFSAGSLGTVYGYNWYIPEDYYDYATVTSKSYTNCTVKALKPGTFELVYWLECDNYGSVRSNWTVLVTPAGYTITYDANGGSNAPASQLQEEGGSITLSNTIPRRNGYLFQGWNYNSNLYQPGATYTFNSDVTLTAAWEFDHYVISYNANGGSNAPSSQNKYPGQTLTLSPTIPVRQGCIFRGWATSSGATTAQWQPGDSFTADQFTTLYAVWEKIPVESVVLDASNLTLKFDSSSQLTATVYPAQASQTVTWSSDNTSVATVSSLGLVTAVGTGDATITATANDQKSAQCTVTVVPDPEKTVKLNSANFPDSYFRNYLINNYDLDANGFLGDEELLQITNIEDLPANTASLTGIKNLTSLKRIDCGTTKVTTLDVSGCISLTTVRARDSNFNGVAYQYLKSFRANGCPSLDWLDVNGSNLKTVYIDNCPSLRYFSGANDASSITLKGCYALETLLIPAISVDLSECYSLKFLWMSNYTASQRVSSVDIRNCPALVSLYYTGKKTSNYGSTIYRNPNDSNNEMMLLDSTTIHAGATLAVLKQPVSMEAAMNETVSFFAGATGKAITFQWQQQTDSGWVDIPGATAMKLELTVEKACAYRCVVTDMDGASISTDAASLTIRYPSFGTPDFVLPDDLQAIEVSAFEGIDAKVVHVPTSCTSIGNYAFRNSGVQRISIPANCTIGEEIFDGCELVYVYGSKGSAAESYCSDHDNCVFVEK